MRAFFVHILASPSPTLYVGLTNNLERRVYEHKHTLVPGFTARYSVNLLVHLATLVHIDDAIAGEMKSRGWR